MIPLHMLDQVELQEDIYLYLLSQSDGPYNTDESDGKDKKKKRTQVCCLTFDLTDLYDEK